METTHTRKLCQVLQMLERKCVALLVSNAVGYGAVNCAIIYHQVLKAMTSNVSVDYTAADMDTFLHVP